MIEAWMYNSGLNKVNLVVEIVLSVPSGLHVTGGGREFHQRRRTGRGQVLRGAGAGTDGDLRGAAGTARRFHHRIGQQVLARGQRGTLDRGRAEPSSEGDGHQRAQPRPGDLRAANPGSRAAHRRRLQPGKRTRRRERGERRSEPRHGADSAGHAWHARMEGNPERQGRPKANRRITRGRPAAQRAARNGTRSNLRARANRAEEKGR